VTAPAIPLVVAALLLLPACAGDTTPAPSIEATPDTASTPTEGTDTGAGGDGPPGAAAAGTSASDADRTILTLVDAGDAPRRSLRYDFSAARLEVPSPGTVTSTFGIAGTTAAGESLPAREATTVAAPTEVTVVEVDDAGTATVEFAFTGGDVVEPGGAEGQELARLEAVMEALAGVRTVFEVDDRGFTTPIGLEGSEASGSRPDVTAITRRVPSFVQPCRTSRSASGRSGRSNGSRTSTGSRSNTPRPSSCWTSTATSSSCCSPSPMRSRPARKALHPPSPDRCSSSN
jgi:hypothetical protein